MSTSARGSPTAVTLALPESPAKGRSEFGMAMRQLQKHRAAVAGALVLLLLVLIALFAPLLAPNDPLRVALAPRFAEPSPELPFGADELGRDLLSRVIFGSRISLTVGAISVGIAAGIGVLFGLLAGYF